MVRKIKAPNLRIEVTEDIIKSSAERDSSHCMIAEAVRIAFPKAAYVAVDLQTIRFSDPEKGFRYTWLTPRVGQAGVINFDQGRLPEPFYFWLKGGQVTRSGKNTSTRNLSDAGKIAKLANLAKANAALKKAVLVRNDNIDSVPTKIGGRPPPMMAFARRRAFGIRALER